LSPLTEQSLVLLLPCMRQLPQLFLLSWLLKLLLLIPDPL
jgi:hypothetical protein